MEKISVGIMFVHLGKEFTISYKLTQDCIYSRIQFSEFSQNLLEAKLCKVTVCTLQPIEWQ